MNLLEPGAFHFVFLFGDVCLRSKIQQKVVIFLICWTRTNWKKTYPILTYCFYFDEGKPMFHKLFSAWVFEIKGGYFIKLLMFGNHRIVDDSLYWLHFRINTWSACRAGNLVCSQCIHLQCLPTYALSYTSMWLIIIFTICCLEWGYVTS